MQEGQRRRDAAASVEGERRGGAEKEGKGDETTGTGENRVYFPPSIVCAFPLSVSLSLSLPHTFD